jgi:hypothetical protein
LMNVLNNHIFDMNSRHNDKRTKKKLKQIKIKAVKTSHQPACLLNWKNNASVVAKQDISCQNEKKDSKK